MAQRTSHKLAKKYFGPFQIIARVNQVAYRVQLPEDARIHLVFHISMLKWCPDPSLTTPCLLLAYTNKAGPIYTLLQILSTRVIQRNKQDVPQLLIHWENGSLKEATWEDQAQIIESFPHHNLDDKISFPGEGDDVRPAHIRPGRAQTLPKRLGGYVVS